MAQVADLISMASNIPLPTIVEEETPAKSWSDFQPYTEMSFFCRSCSLSCSKLSELRIHLFTQHVCLMCRKHFKTPANLKQHLISAHRDGLKCSICQDVKLGTFTNSFIHFNLLHSEHFSAISCSCSGGVTSLEKHIAVSVAKASNQMWKTKREAVMHLRCIVEIRPIPLLKKEIGKILLFEASHSLEVQESLTKKDGPENTNVNHLITRKQPSCKTNTQEIKSKNTCRKDKQTSKSKSSNKKSSKRREKRA